MFFAPLNQDKKPKISIMVALKTSDHIQINIRMQNPIQEPPASSKAPYEDLKNMDDLCSSKINIESQSSEHRCIKDRGQYPNEDQDAKPQSGTSSPPPKPQIRT